MKLSSKKFLSILLSLCMLFGLFSTMAFADGENTASITVGVTYGDGQPLAGAVFILKNTETDTAYEATSTSEGTVTFSNLPAGTYELTQISAPAGYNRDLTTTIFLVNYSAEYIVQTVNPDGTTSRYEGALAYHNTIDNSNTPQPKTINVTAVKEWDTSKEVELPESVTVRLLANSQLMTGNEYAVKLNDSNEWSHTWVNLPSADESGSPISYSISEDEIENFAPTFSEPLVDENGNIELAVTNTFIAGAETEPTAATLVIKKVDQDNNPLAGATFHLTESGLTEPSYVAVSGEDGLVTFTDVAAGYYILSEHSAPEGYAPTEETYSFNINEDGQISGFAANLPNGILYNNTQPWTITNTLIAGDEDEDRTTTITVQKVWENVPEGTTLPESVTVYLVNNTTKIDGTEVTLTANNNWTYTWNNLPVNDTNGDEIIYDLFEVAIDGYSSEVIGPTGTDGGGIQFIVTNTYNAGNEEENRTTNIVVQKVWENVPEGTTLPESVTVYLVNDTTKIDGTEVTLTANNNWTYTWNNLPVNDTNGDEIIYDLFEVAIDGYSSEVTGPTGTDTGGIQFIVTNTYNAGNEPDPEPESIDITVEKVWNVPANTLLPNQIELKLYANGVEVPDSTMILQGINNSWNGIWEDVPTTDNNGRKITYTVSETAIEGYTTTISGPVETDTGIQFTVTNSLKTNPTPENISVTVEKVWKNVPEGTTLPASITLNLFANGEKLQSVPLTAEDSWTYTWTVPAVDESGASINYTVTEDDLLNYRPDIAAITDSVTGNITVTVTNTFIAGDETEPIYTVTVNNGDGDGDYNEGVTVTIKADPAAEGYEFDKWVVDTANAALVDETSEETTFTMPPEDVTVTATYKEKTSNPNPNPNPNPPTDPNKPTHPDIVINPPAEKDSPDTGDNTHILIGAAVLALGACAVLGLGISKKRKSR